MAVSNFVTPYPDFKNNEIINPDEFDANSLAINNKLNEIIALLNAFNTQATLWTGSFYMHGTQTITPSKKLSECRTGWVLEWSDYDKSNSAVNEYDYHYSYVIKSVVKDKWVMFDIPNNVTAGATVSISGKQLKFTDATITGHDNNDDPSPLSSDDVVLRRVIEF